MHLDSRKRLAAVREAEIDANCVCTIEDTASTREFTGSMASCRELHENGDDRHRASDLD